MAYAPPALRRRTRRRRTFLIVLILAVVFGLVALAVRYRTERRVAVDYLDSARAIVDEEITLATALEEVFIDLGDLERQDILDRLAELSAESAELRETLAELDLTGSVGEAHGYLTVAVGSWDDALGLLDEAVVEVLDGEVAQTGDGMLQSAFDLLRIGDRAYFGFLAVVAELDPEIATQEFPDVGYTGGDRTALYDAPVIADRLSSILKLSGEHDVSLTATIDPEPLIEPGSIPIVPNAETFIVNLVISNVGNLPEERILVSLTGNPQSADAEPIDLNSMVLTLGPGESTTVSFDVSDLVLPGELYELRAAADIAEDDTEPDNNVWSLVLVRNAE